MNAHCNLAFCTMHSKVYLSANFCQPLTAYWDNAETVNDCDTERRVHSRRIRKNVTISQYFQRIYYRQ